MSYNPFVVIPPLTSCETAYIVFGQGTAPYNVFPISSGGTNATSLEAIPVLQNAGVLTWRVDFDPGANLTFVVIDGKGVQAYSQYRVVQSNGGPSTTCPKTVYESPKSQIGAIIGGVVGGLAFIALGLITYFYLRKKRHASFPSHSNSMEGIAEMETPAGVRRAGTFNLHNVAFTDTEVSRAALEPPPQYQKRHRFSRNRATSPGIAEAEEDSRSNSPAVGTNAERLFEEGGSPGTPEGGSSSSTSHVA